MVFDLTPLSPLVTLHIHPVGFCRLLAMANAEQTPVHKFIRHTIFDALGVAVNDTLDGRGNRGDYTPEELLRRPYVMVSVRMPHGVLNRLHKLCTRAATQGRGVVKRSEMLRRLISRATQIPLADLSVGKPGRPKHPAPKFKCANCGCEHVIPAHYPHTIQSTS